MPSSANINRSIAIIKEYLMVNIYKQARLDLLTQQTVLSRIMRVLALPDTPITLDDVYSDLVHLLERPELNSGIREQIIRLIGPVEPPITILDIGDPEHGNMGAMFSADSKRLLAGGHYLGVQLWSVEHPERLFATNVPEIALDRPIFPPTGDHILTGASDAKIRVWSSHSGELLREIAQPYSTVYSLVFSPTGDYLLACCGDQSVEFIVSLVEADTLTEVHALTDKRTIAYSATFSPDGRFILTGHGHDLCQIRLWDIQTRQVVHVLDNLEREIDEIVFSPDGQYFAAVTPEKVWLWKWSSLQLLYCLDNHLSPISFSPDSKCLLATDRLSRQIHLYNINTGERLHTFKWLVGIPSTLAFSPDGEYMAIGDRYGKIRLWRYRDAYQ